MVIINEIRDTIWPSPKQVNKACGVLVKALTYLNTILFNIQDPRANICTRIFIKKLPSPGSNPGPQVPQPGSTEPFGHPKTQFRASRIVFGSCINFAMTTILSPNQRNDYCSSTLVQATIVFSRGGSQPRGHKYIGCGWTVDALFIKLEHFSNFNFFNVLLVDVVNSLL